MHSKIDPGIHESDFSSVLLHRSSLVVPPPVHFLLPRRLFCIAVDYPVHFLLPRRWFCIAVDYPVHRSQFSSCSVLYHPAAVAS